MHRILDAVCPPTRATPMLGIVLAGLVVSTASPAAARVADPLAPAQWGLGPRAAGVPGAWLRTRGAGVVVAVLDSGVQLDHPDLAQNLWANPDEIPKNGIDDDSDGYIDDVHGANISGFGGDPSDDNGHGTHIAGIVAAVAGNDVGGSGVAPEARIMAVKVLDARASGDQGSIARGIRYALAHGADIINLSVNGDTPDDDVAAAIAEADRAGVTVVASAGNAARNIDVRPSFPASLDAPNLVTVTATQPDGGCWFQGNSGRRAVDLAAPGKDILSTDLDSGWGRRSGTSMAAPFVAAGLALLTAAHPELSAAQLRAALLAGARRDRGLRGAVGFGRLDLTGALRLADATGP
jgi:subtilisin family serine protease